MLSLEKPRGMLFWHCYLSSLGKEWYEKELGSLLCIPVWEQISSLFCQRRQSKESKVTAEGMRYFKIRLDGCRLILSLPDVSRICAHLMEQIPLCCFLILFPLSPLSVRLCSEVWGLPAQQRGGLCQQWPQLQREAWWDSVHGAGGGQPVRACPVHGDGPGTPWPTHLGDHREARPGRTSSSFSSDKGNEDNACEKKRCWRKRLLLCQSKCH